MEEDRIILDEQKSGLLAWWSANSGKYPILMKIVQDVLAMPICIVPSESAFSKDGKLISAHRSKAHPLAIEALMYLQSWRFMIFQDAVKENPFALGTIDDDADVDGDCDYDA